MANRPRWSRNPRRYPRLRFTDRLRDSHEPHRAQVLKPASRPPFIIGMLLQLFQQFSGINAIMFYAPVLFQTVGFGSNAALLSAVITGSINVLSTFVGIYLLSIELAGGSFFYNLPFTCSFPRYIDVFFLNYLLLNLCLLCLVLS